MAKINYNVTILLPDNTIKGTETIAARDFLSATGKAVKLAKRYKGRIVKLEEQS